MSDIVLSPSAAARVATIAQRQAKPAILRLSVDGGGCAGFQYRFELADAVASDDAVADEGGVTLVVDPISLDGFSRPIAPRKRVKPLPAIS